MNVSALKVYIRDLTGVYSTDIVSDALLLRWLNEAYFELARRATWPWVATELVNDTDVPAFDGQFHAALAYRGAIKTLQFVSDDTKRGEMYMSEYGILVTDMERYYLPSAATGTSTDLVGMRRVVRDLTGFYSEQSLPDALINTYLNNAYNELARRHDWDWLEATYDVALPAAVGGVHSLSLPNGTRRVLEAYIVFDSGEVQEMVNTPNLARIEVNDSGVYYDVDFSGNVTIKPVQDNVDKVKFRYLMSTVNMTLDTDVPAFDAQFRMILPYRAAISVLMHIRPDDGRMQVYETEFSSLYEGMYTMYELVSDNRPFQLGEDGVQTRRYYPWFRPA